MDNFYLSLVTIMVFVGLMLAITGIQECCGCGYTPPPIVEKESKKKKVLKTILRYVN